MEDRCLEPRREDFPPRSGSHLLCELWRVSFTSAGGMLPRRKSSAGTPLAGQGPGSALGMGWGGRPVPLRSAGSMYLPHPRRPLHLQGVEKQRKKFISRKQTQMYQPSAVYLGLPGIKCRRRNNIRKTSQGAAFPHHRLLLRAVAGWGLKKFLKIARGI